ncbi:MAG: nitronate monooxygenase, partial [Chloroflexi bacterium]|nr:nitronate monooxygenase [Chloroflexota bacterium]
LGIQYPIMQGGLAGLGTAEFAAAVSNAGALGTLTASVYKTKDDLREAIRRAKSLTDKPFAVNISIFPTAQPERTEMDFSTVIEEGVKVVETSGRSPEPFVPRLKESNIKLIHKVPGVKYAITTEKVGADIVSVVGTECGGHPGMDDVATLVLVPMTVDAVKIPVLAGGGIGDARGLIASLALGAEGVVMGTRFLATIECPAHPVYKETLVKARETDTMLIERSLRMPVRALKNENTQRILEMENKGAPVEEILPLIRGDRSKRAYEEGILDGATLICGEAVGFIQDVVSVKDLIDSMAQGALAIKNRLNTIL